MLLRFKARRTWRRQRPELLWGKAQSSTTSTSAFPSLHRRKTVKKFALTWSFIVDISLSNISCVLRVESKLLKYIEVAPTASRTKCCCNPPSLPGWQTTSKLLSFLSSHARGGSGTPGNGIKHGFVVLINVQSSSYWCEHKWMNIYGLVRCERGTATIDVRRHSSPSRRALRYQRRFAVNTSQHWASHASWFGNSRPVATRSEEIRIIFHYAGHPLHNKI